MSKMDGSTVDISVLIINYMTYQQTINAIESVVENTSKVSYEIILLDNGSPNGDGDRLEEYCEQHNLIKFIKNKTNVGFSKGNNIALNKSIGKYVVFLNSDTVLTTNSLYKGKEYIDTNVEIGALSAKLIDSDGKLDNGCMRGFPTPENTLYYFLKLDKLMKSKTKYSGYKLTHLSPDEINEVDVISGAFFMVKRSLLDEIGSFDESFFMYGEDIDLCFRIKNFGKKIVYNPEIGEVIHYKGQSRKKRKWRTLFHFYNAMIIFYRKNYQKRYNLIVSCIVYIGIVSMFFASLIANFIKRG